MTGDQDEICDRLVGSKISKNWVGGPLHVAALVLDPSFVPSPRNDSRPRQFARAVGWPVTFCEGITGANAALSNEDDRRSLAIAIFSRVHPHRPGKRAPSIPARITHEATQWAALRAHESACGMDCPLHQAALVMLNAVEGGGTWATIFRTDSECKTAPRMHHVRVSPSSSAAHHAVVAMRYLDSMMIQPQAQYYMLDALRESAKAETKVHGVSGSVEFCLTLAEKLGLRMSTLS